MFDCIGLASRSINASIDFYNLFDLEFIAYGEGHFEATTSTGFRLMLDSHELLKELNPEFKECTNSTTTLGFNVKNPAKVDEIYKSVIDKGYKSIKEPWDAFWGQRYASVLDPDNNQVDIFASL